MAAEASPSGGNPAAGLLHWFAARPRFTLVLAVLAALGPFLAKPFNFDDPLFLWTARQIQSHPANPYGFNLNWYGHLDPMWEVTKNPPLAAYYLAFSAMLLGWRELALHGAFLLPAIAAILGTHRLARNFCGQPLIAAGATLFTPAFLVSSSTVMCDTLMLAFWVWAVILWVEGSERNQQWRLAASAALIALAALTKYFGACLIPLLAAYSLVRARKIGIWAAWFLIPMVSLGAYEWATHSLYGKGMLSDAGAYATAYRELFGMSRAVTVLVALAFTGGCLAVATLLAPLLWRGWTLPGFALVAALLSALFFFFGPTSGNYGNFVGSSRALVTIQLFFWAAGGLSVLALAVVDVWQRRDPGAGLLAAWVLGTFAFVAFCNWDVNARSLLPMAPAVGILLVRRLEKTAPVGENFNLWRRNAAMRFACGAALAWLVLRADCKLAAGVRSSADETCARYRREGSTLWFEGHWGFQYYMEANGAMAAGMDWRAVKRGDFAAIPFNNTNTGLPTNVVTHQEEILYSASPHWLTTGGLEVGAGFYASVLGPLPFAVGRTLPGQVLVLSLEPQAPDQP